MPSKNSVKTYAPNQMWHVYNRGVDGRDVFMDERDYAVFLSFFKLCLTPEMPETETLNALPLGLDVIRLRRLNLYKEVELVSYCLMKNHFHLQLFQYSEDSISKLMRSIMTGYVMYFNNRQERTGRLFQGVYKASLIDSDAYWQHISRYIHLNPLDIAKDYKTYPYSSYKYYTAPPAPTWLQPGHVLDSFKQNEYASFVANYVNHKSQVDDIKHLLADK